MASPAFVLALALSHAEPADAQVPLIDTFGGSQGYGTDFLPPNDDGSSAAIDLTPAFGAGGVQFFGGSHTTAFVNTNGNITFSGALRQFTPDPFPVADQPMIAPYWADVDIRGRGFPSSNGVWWAVRPGQFVVTWNDVGYYSRQDDLKMDFQLILSNSLTCGAGDFDVEFRYHRCEWTTGNASGGSGGLGGTPAQAGFDAGNNTDFVEIPGSRTMGILRLCTESNVGMPGIWRFGIRGGQVICPDAGQTCATGMDGACGVGVSQCVAGGTECIPVGAASDEVCDGIDNDCDGEIDNGNLCEGLDVCSSGRCVPPCFEGGCPGDLICTDQGACVDTSCMDVTCDASERCEAGICVGLCDGVLCPHDQNCLSGRCVDVCDIITCGEDEHCADGACRGSCPCTPCGADETCSADGSCTPVGCDLTTCDAGFYCQDGSCLDACDGALCPTGHSCFEGDCVPGDAPGGSSGDAGVSGESVPDGGDAGHGDADDGGTGRMRYGESGCGCRIESLASDVDRSSPRAFGLLGLLGLIVVARRRR